MNQVEVDSYDQHIWRNYRNSIYSNIRNLAKQKKIVSYVDTVLYYDKNFVKDDF